jgi:hypothetical protein
MRKRVITVTITCAVAMTACGGPSTQAVHGQVVGGTQAAATVFAANGAAGICAGAVEGTQVIVKGPSGTLLTTTTLQGRQGLQRTWRTGFAVVGAGRGVRVLSDDSRRVRRAGLRSR